MPNLLPRTMGVNISLSRMIIRTGWMLGWS